MRGMDEVVRDIGGIADQTLHQPASLILIVFGTGPSHQGLITETFALVSAPQDGRCQTLSGIWVRCSETFTRRPVKNKYVADETATT